MKYFTITAKIVEVIVLSVKMRSRDGTSSMNTIDLFREIMQEDLPECRRDPDRFSRTVVRRLSAMFTHPHSSL